VVALGVAEATAWFGEAELSAEEVGEWVDDAGGVAAGAVAVAEAGRVRGFGSPGRPKVSALVLRKGVATSLANEAI
jgi:hypothetical protein